MMWAGFVLLLWYAKATQAPSSAPSLPPTILPGPASTLETQYIVGGIITFVICCFCLCLSYCCKDRRKPTPAQPLTPEDIPIPSLDSEDDKVLYDDRFGVSFSGGGIRSAAFCSGVLWGLINYEPPEREKETDWFDGGVSVSLPYGKMPQFISCVSGGGYVGASFTYWARIYRGQDPRKWTDLYFARMRRGIGYYCDCTSMLSGVYDTAVFIGMIVLLVVLSVLAFFPTTYVMGEFILLPYSAYYNAFANTTGWPVELEEFAIKSGVNEWNNDMLWVLWLIIVTGFPIYLVVSWIVHQKANDELKNTYIGASHTKRYLRGWKLFAEIMSHLNYALLSVFVIIVMVVLFDFSSDEGYGGTLNSPLTTTAVIWSLRLIILYLMFTQSLGILPLFIQAQLVIWIYYAPHRAMMIPSDDNFDNNYRMFAVTSKILLPFLAILGLLRERIIFEFSRWRLSRCFFAVPAAKHFTLAYLQRANKISRLMWKPPKFGQYPTYIACTTVNGWMVIPPTDCLYDPEELMREQTFDFYYERLSPQDKVKVDEVLTKAKLFSPLAASRTLATTDYDKPAHKASGRVNNSQVLDEAIVLARNIVMSNEKNRERVQQFEDTKEQRAEILAQNLRELAWSQARLTSAGFDILAMSTEGWWERYEDGMTTPLKIYPRDVQETADPNSIVGANPEMLLSEAMCMSAAAGSFSNGDLGKFGGRDDERAQVMFGFHMGRWVETSVKRGASSLLYLVIVDFFIALPVLILGGTDDPFARTEMSYQTGSNNGNYYAYLGGALSLTFFVIWCSCLPVFSYFFPKIYPFLPRARDFLTLTGEVMWSHKIPSMLYLSDGGHTENLGLCPLLARRLQYIVVACGAEDETCRALRSALEQARQKLGCWFRPVRADQQRRRVDRVTSDPELDLLSDIAFFARDDARVMVIEVMYREQTRSWRNTASRAFVPNAKPLNDKGYIFYLKPIFVHPRGFMSSSETMLRDEPYGAKCLKPIPPTHEALAGCFCTCCHRWACLRAFSGKFPFHHTAFQFFTPMLFDAYHAQGVQSLKDAFSVVLKANSRHNTQFTETKTSWGPPELVELIPTTLEGVKKTN